MIKGSTSARSIETYATDFLTIFDDVKPYEPTSADIEKFTSWGYTPSLGFFDHHYSEYGSVMLWVIELVESWDKAGTSPAMIKKIVTQTRKKIAEIKGLTLSKKSIESPIVIRLFKQATSQVAKVNQTTRTNKTHETTRNVAMKDAVALVDFAAKILTNTEINNNYDAANVALALEVVTGRRCYSEILNGCSFLPKTSHSLAFQGQAKNIAKQNESYVIPTLCDSEIIAVAHDRLTDYLLEKAWFDPSENQSTLIQSNFVNPISKALKSYPNFIDSSHDLRKFYACYAFHTLANSYNFAKHAGKILGHGSYDEAGNFITDGETTGSYDKYKFV